MPQPNYPPPQNEAGAITQPRQLQRWLDVNYQGGKLTRTRGYIQLPAFQYINPTEWLGYSDIIVAYNYEGTSNFSLKPFIAQTNPVFTLCIMWTDANYKTHRCSLWRSSQDRIFFQIPVYNGQMIGANFRLEVWSTPVSSFSYAGMNFYTSVLGGLDYRYGSDFLLDNPDPEVIVFYERGSSGGITMDSTVITIDNSNVTMDETVTGGFPLPFQFPLNASPEINSILLPPVNEEDNLSSL